MTKPKLISIGVLAIAVVTSGFILLSRKTEVSLTAPTRAITAGDIQKATVTDTPMIEEGSLTGQAAKTIADSLAQANPNGPHIDPVDPSQNSISAKDPKAIATQIISDQTQKVTADVLHPTIDPAGINVSKTATAKAYLAADTKIFTDAQNSLADLAPKSFDETTLAAMNRITEGVLEKLKGLPVPQSLVAIHTEQLRLLIAQQTIFTNILNHSSDPMAASVSISLLKQVDAESIALGKKLHALVQSSG